MPDVALYNRSILRWITLIAVLIAVPMVYSVVLWTRHTYFTDLHGRAQDELKVQLAYMQSRMDSLEMITHIVGSDERVVSFIGEPEDPKLLWQVNHFLTRLSVTAGSIAYIIDPQGKVLASGNWTAEDSFVGRELGFRPYFKASLMGETAQYVAVGTTSRRLGFYVSVPIRVNGKVAGVAVTKTDPQDLIIPHTRGTRPLIITDAHGVTVISRPKNYLFHALKPYAPKTGGPAGNPPRYLDKTIKPLSTRPIENLNKVRLITLDAEDGADPRRYVMAHAVVPSSGWNAYMLWPAVGLKATLFQRLSLTVLALIVTWLLCLYGIERWRHLKQMQEHAFRDPLTGLYSRLYMLESASALLAAHDRQSIPGVSAILFDLDRFKMINDRYGHSAGDNVLVKVGRVLMDECRESDIPIRYGGEEFLVFAPSGDRMQILQLAERIRLQIKALEIKLDGRAIRMTISGGIATHLTGEPLEKLIDRADQMMYQAKQNGRDQIKWEPDPSNEPSR